MKSFTSAVLASRASLLYRVDGSNGARCYWAYVLVDEPKLAQFKLAVEAGDIEVQAFGKILAWGQGEEPPMNVARDLKTTYGFDLIA